ncbi:GntR family transcriptional regulator [Streptomyces sp. NPDC020917]|uniref:GntR family transcriptional regulator n=1 Tax=Streptomyces sp. NPDC020917 TaxID=3365102 RepID=UPI0037B0E434
MSLDPNDSRPKSVQVADVLRAEISAGKHGGGKLPPTRDLAKRFGIAGQTLSNGLRILVDEGLIFSAGNLGYFVAKADQESAEAKPDVTEEIKGLHSQIEALTQRVAALEERSGSVGA